jgi:molybdopterin molybdotransferase
MRLPNQAGTKSFVRVVVKRINNEYYVEPLRLTGSGILSTLTKANGILVVDENSEGFEEGEYVDVILTQPPEVGK